MFSDCNSAKIIFCLTSISFGEDVNIPLIIAMSFMISYPFKWVLQTTKTIVNN